MALFPTDKVIHITMEYLANDPELHEFFAYIQSEKFPKIHRAVEYLQEYENVSAFMCLFLKHQSDREILCSVSTNGSIVLF